MSVKLFFVKNEASERVETVRADFFEPVWRRAPWRVLWVLT